MDFVVLRLVIGALLPVIAAVIFYLAEKKTKYAQLSYRTKQMLVGLVFGGIAILATEFGIDIDGAVINVRTAAPLTAGLLFGGPAGIIAGLIGGIHRWFAVLWGVGVYSQLACTIATILAGFFGAACHRFLFDSKKALWFYGLIIGITTEVMHMLLVFMTHMDDIHTAFVVVSKCALPMITANGLSVMTALLIVSLLGREKTQKPKKELKQISQIFQFVLMGCIIAAFIVTSLFTYNLQTNIANSDTNELLKLNIKDVKAEISDASDDNLLSLSEEIAGEIDSAPDNEELSALTEKYNVAGINYVNDEGIIAASTKPQFINYDIRDSKASAEFLRLLDGTHSYVQKYQPTAYDKRISRKYAGVALKSGGFIQVGYDAKRFQADIAGHVRKAAANRHIGHDGDIIICDENFNIVSNQKELDGKNIRGDGSWKSDNIRENVRFTATVKKEDAYCMYSRTEGYFVVAAIPVDEAMFSRNIAVYITAFMEILVFAALFVNIYFLIKRLVVNNIRKVNASLSKITGGDLSVTVDVRENEEFASLSDDINATVSTLKYYIDEAAARIDKELEFAKAIQYSALPSVFPPYPGRKDFEIFALMDTAKEVGGDFYDFYLLDNDRLGFTIADVSGKGIPAAMFMMTAKTTIKGFAESGMDVDEMLTRANDELCDGNDTGMFVTAWVGILDLRSGLLSYANAGHNPPLICHKGGNFEYLRTRANFVLAGMEGVNYKKGEIQFAPGDVIYLYTDGVVEATSRETQLYGEDRLLEQINKNPDETVEERCNNVLDDVELFVGEADQFDDITMLSVKLNFLQSFDRVVVCPEMNSRDAIGDFIEYKIEKSEMPKKLANKFRVCVDEIYSNIEQYSGASKAEISCNIDELVLTLIFRDNGVPYDPTATEEPPTNLSAEERKIGGLGIFMVKKLSNSMHYAYTDNQNVLTITFSLLSDQES